MKALPLVTIIMPCRNEAGFIDRSLGSALAQDYPADRLEIIVADGMSEDGTPDLARAMLADAPQHSEVIANPARNTPAALNLCLERARGDVVIYLIAHCELPPDYVRRCVEILDRTGADLVGGTIETRGEGSAGRAIALALGSTIGVGGSAFRTRPGLSGFVDTVALGAYRREIFDRVGGFDPAFIRNQDAEHSFRIVRSGGRIWLDASLRSVYNSRPTFRTLWTQHFRTGASKMQIFAKHRRMPKLRHYLPGAFVLATAASLVAGIVLREPLLALSVIAPYLVAVFVASAWIARRELARWPAVVLTVLTLHFSYGLGFLSGLSRLLRRPSGQPTSVRDEPPARRS